MDTLENPEPWLSPSARLRAAFCRADKSWLLVSIIAGLCSLALLFAVISIRLGLWNTSSGSNESGPFNSIAGAWHGRDFVLVVEPDGSGTLTFNTKQCDDSCTHEALVVLEHTEADTYLRIAKPENNAIPDQPSTPKSGLYLIFISNVPLHSADDREMRFIDTKEMKTVAHACTSLRHPTTACVS